MDAALAAARFRAVSFRLLALHKAVIDAERHRYESQYGRIQSAHAALDLVMSDPWFHWIKPLTTLIVQADERLATDPPVAAADLATFVASVRALVQVDPADGAFRQRYIHVLQASPDAVVAHGHLMALLAEHWDRRREL